MIRGKEYKIIFTGTMGAGKTTAISAISDNAPVKTDVSNSDQATYAKALTTVAMDYGEVALDGGDRIRLYGTPGQERFSFMWSILAKGALGVVLLIDHSSSTPLEDLERFIVAFDEPARRAAMVIGITHRDLGVGPTMADYSAVLSKRSLALPMFSIDGRDRDQIFLLVDALLTSIEMQG